jgi:hypothetical protein
VQAVDGLHAVEAIRGLRALHAAAHAPVSGDREAVDDRVSGDGGASPGRT